MATKKKNPAAVELGRLGGKKGGLARAAAMTPEQRQASARKAGSARKEKLTPSERSEIARKASEARWDAYRSQLINAAAAEHQVSARKAGSVQTKITPSERSEIARQVSEAQSEAEKVDLLNAPIVSSVAAQVLHLIREELKPVLGNHRDPLRLFLIRFLLLSYPEYRRADDVVRRITRLTAVYNSSIEDAVKRRVLKSLGVSGAPIPPLLD